MLGTRLRKQLFLMAGDGAVLVAMLALSLIVRSRAPAGLEEFGLHFIYFWPTFFGWGLLLYIANLYSPELAFGSDLKLGRLFGVSVLGTLSTAVLFYLKKSVPITPKTLLAIYGALSFAGLSAWRAFASYLGRELFARTSVAFVGWSPAARDLCELLAAERHRGYELIGALPGEGEAGGFPEGLPILREMPASGQTSDMLYVIGDESRLPKEFRLSLFSLLGEKVRFTRLDDFYELVFRRVPIGIIDDLWFLENLDLVSKRSYSLFKRLIDIFIAVIGLTLSLPLWPFIVLGVKLGSKGPVFFAQKRIGRGGSIFTLFKFRTMRVEGNDYKPTEKSDNRVTGFGRFLRASRLDELPQLLNVLGGSMSFIGPRPERPELAAELAQAIPFYHQRSLIKPGLTGWDQVSGEYHSPSVEDTYKKLQYDLYYLKNMGLILDISIFLKTIMTVLLRVGR